MRSYNAGQGNGTHNQQNDIHNLLLLIFFLLENNLSARQQRANAAAGVKS